MNKPGLPHSLRRHRLLLPIAAALFAVANWACDSGSGVGTATVARPAASLDLDGTELAVVVGDTSAYDGFDVINPAFADLTLTTGDKYGRLTGVTVQWTSSDPSTVSVRTANVVTGTASGCNDCHVRFYGSKVYFTGLKSGTATITGVVIGSPTVNNQRVAASFTVVVTGQATKVVANPRTVSITAAPGDSVQLSAYAYAADGTQLLQSVEWTCGDSKIASLGNAQLGGLRCGDTTITGGAYAVQSHVAVLHPVKTGSTYVVATYSYNPGKTTATQIVLTDTVHVVVTAGVARVVVTPSAASILIGANRQLTAQAFDAAGNLISGLPVTWVSRNTSVIAVNATNGNVQGIASGAAPGQTQTATATATIGGVSGDGVITVYRKPGNVVVTPTPNTLGIGQSVTLHAKLVDSDNTTQIPFSATSLSWSSDNGTIARVTAIDDSTATVTGVAVGTTQARATAATGVTGVADVSVIARTGGTPTSIAISPTSATIRDGQTQQFTATLRDASGTVVPIPAGGVINFVLDDSNIGAPLNATGLIMGYATGTTTVRALYQLNGQQTNLNAAATLTVIP